MKKCGNAFPTRSRLTTPLVLYCAKQSGVNLQQCFNKFEKSIVSVKLCDQPTRVNSLIKRLADFFSHSIKMRGLLEYYADLWERTFIVKV